jgi:stress-induced-phosphoprotein 1
VTLFSQAIELAPGNHILFSNRSGAYVSLGEFEAALEDAQQSVVLRPDYVRGYKRKGLALFKMGRYAEAAEAYSTGLKLDPSNAELKADLA